MSNKTCGECKCYNDAMFHCEKFDCMAEAFNTCEDFEPKVITNGDVIRQQVSQMNNKELTMFLTTGMCHYCDNYQTARCNPSYCEIHIEAHLNAPAESEGKDE